ncbi:MAG: hypothetical protein EBU82_05805 [Flavobacteriia bacterium]|nr:hypothetical protein [Flavobacteriia bacterium]
MAALFPKIYDIIDQNPTKHTTLRCGSPISTEGSPELWDCFSLKPLNPPGALSLLLLQFDPMYELGSPALRKQILTEQLMTLHERVDKELVGRRFPRKKIQDLLASQVSAQAPIDSFLLEEVLCELFHVQKILMDRRSKTIRFAPSDPRLWVSDRRIVFSEADNCWSFQASQSKPLSEWLEQKEQDGWKVSWPTADKKFEELKQVLLQSNSLPQGKFKKDDLAEILGRRQTIALFQTLQLKTC